MTTQWWMRLLWWRSRSCGPASDASAALEVEPAAEGAFDKTAAPAPAGELRSRAHRGATDGGSPDVESIATLTSADAAPVREGDVVVAEPPPEPPEPNVATTASLGRSMAWRTRVIVDGASPGSPRSDGPALVESLLEGGQSLVRQPPAATQRALESSRRADASTKRIAALFEHDPTLTQALLSMAGSPFYRRREPLTTIADAVATVGPGAAQSVLLQGMVEAMLCRPGGPFYVMVGMVWSHMRRSAPIARAIAPEFGVMPDTAYTLALLHDVGKLVILDHATALRRLMRRDLQIPPPLLSGILRHLHEPVGGLAMLRWGMGGEAAHAVAGHHRHPLPDTSDPLTEVLYVAEAVDLAQSNHARFDWAKVWSEGGITADQAGVGERLTRMEA